MSEKTGGTKTIGSVEKAIQILDILAQSEGGLGVTEISRNLQCGVSATYHLLNTLKQHDLLQQDSRSKKYSIGFGLFRLCALARKQDVLSTVAQPFLDELCQSCEETSNLLILQDMEVVYVAQSESRNMLKMFTQLGARAPYYCTGGGKAILAFMPKELWQVYAEGTEFFAFTPRTITSPAALLRELEAIRQQGFSYDKEEREDGVTCIAAPVFDASGRPAAALSISGPTHRLSNKGMERLTDAVTATAAGLSRRLAAAN